MEVEYIDERTVECPFIMEDVIEWVSGFPSDHVRGLRVHFGGPALRQVDLYGSNSLTDIVSVTWGLFNPSGRASFVHVDGLVNVARRAYERREGHIWVFTPPSDGDIYLVDLLKEKFARSDTKEGFTQITRRMQSTLAHEIGHYVRFLTLGPDRWARDLPLFSEAFARTYAKRHMDIIKTGG